MGRHRSRPRHVHAGRLRVPRGGPHPDEERRPHRGQERPRPRPRVHRLLPGRLRPRLRGRRQRARRRVRLRSLRGRAADRRRGAVLLVRLDPRGRGLPVRGRLLRGLAGDRLGRHGRAHAPVGLLRLRDRVHAHLLRRLPLDLEPGRLALLPRHAGLRGLDRRPLPGGARRPGRGAPARAAHRQVRLRREAERDPRAQHGLHDARRHHPLVRVVRLQPGLDAQRGLRRRRLLRLRRAEHEHRGGGRQSSAQC